MTLEELYEEYDAHVIGPRIEKRITDLVKQALRRRKVSSLTVAAGSHSSEDAASAVANDFMFFLSTNRQLRFAIEHANSLEHFDGLIGRQLKRYLSASRYPSVLNNVLKLSLIHI